MSRQEYFLTPTTIKSTRRTRPIMDYSSDSRRQLNDLPDKLAAKLTIHYYFHARDALLKALSL